MSGAPCRSSVIHFERDSINSTTRGPLTLLRQLRNDRAPGLLIKHAGNWQVLRTR